MKLFRVHIMILLAFAGLSLRAQVGSGDLAQATGSNYWKWNKKGNFYFSWGYSKWWYPKTDIQFDIKNPASGTRTGHSEYTLKDVYAHDAAWLSQIGSLPLTVPQFCTRIGYFFNSDQSLGIEFTYDHAKFVVNTDQYVEMKGATNGVAFDSIAHLYPDDEPGSQPFIFKLNNGANFFAFTLVKKFKLFQNKKGNFSLFYLLKGGLGWNIPHVENNIFGVKNDPHFQPFSGWNVGVEGALRALFFNRVYLEFGQKGVYASYYNLKLAEGTAKVHFATYGTIFSVGINFPGKVNTVLTTNAE